MYHRQNMYWHKTTIPQGVAVCFSTRKHRRYFFTAVLLHKQLQHLSYIQPLQHIYLHRELPAEKKKICIKNVTLNFRIVETTYVKVADIYIFFSFSRQEIISVPQNPIVGTPLRQSAHGHEAHNKKMLMHWSLQLWAVIVLASDKVMP